LLRLNLSARKVWALVFHPASPLTEKENNVLANHTYRLHPAINIARVGNSEEFYLAPETMAGQPVEAGAAAWGGLPIKPGTESETITSNDLRDANGAFKRQAARFRVFQYPAETPETYPNGGGVEIKIGSVIDGLAVTNIIWTVHLANKKANCFVLENPNLPDEDLVIQGYENGLLPPLRNLFEGPDPNDPVRVRKLTIDPGPRTISGVNSAPVRFDRKTTASFWDECTGQVTTIDNYPKSFPSDSFKLFSPSGDIDTLGQLQTDESGRLLVLGGYGRACAWKDPNTNKPYPLNDDVDNDGWFDDTSDGPVSAVLVFKDGSTAQVKGAWAVATDPSYAPQTLNLVSLWDEFYDTWVRQLQLAPDIFDAQGQFVSTYQPTYDDQVHPLFRAARMQQWNTNLPDGAIDGHKMADGLKGTDPPNQQIFGLIRNPNTPGDGHLTTAMMPLALGDSGKSFLFPTITQYFFLTKWSQTTFQPGSGPPLGPGEYLDKAVLVNCLGGRFSPGIDMTFIVRQPELYIQNWQTSGTGPFRIKPAPLDYNAAQSGQPFLTEGYVPIHSGPSGLEPGDTSKFMALPWHTDYNSCGTHPTDPNPLKSKRLYWSWPAQRPYTVYAAKDVVAGGPLPAQRFSVRGVGTSSPDQSKQGRYQARLDIVTHWPKIGVIIQGSSIDGGTFDPTFFLEVVSQLDDSGNTVVPWPNNAS
jgi:hypothetical protein